MDKPQGPVDDVDHATLRHMLLLGGDTMRPALIAQLRDDLRRLRDSLNQDDAAALKQATHELKGLSSTIGANALAELSARLDDLGDSLTPAARGAMALGLRIQIDKLDSVLEAEAAASATP